MSDDRATALIERLTGGLIPAVPVPFRGDEIDRAAQQQYARWMATQPVAGVAVWAHTGRGPHLGADQRRDVLDTWREALADRIVIAGARDIGMAIEARRGRADALLAFPQADNPVVYHQRLGRELPVIAFYLYREAGGVAYDDATLHRIMELPEVIGIKVATLDSVMTFQRVAGVLRDHPSKLLITGEDRFLGYSLLLGARSALIGMGAALPDLQADLVKAALTEDWNRFVSLSELCDRFAQTTFIEPIEGYIRRMLWAAAAEGAFSPEACDDPWGPTLPSGEREAVERAVRDARAARA
ncbi:MAG TPA: dihydrodipicolinate synthase family protein [Gemmatimonadales bacterium]|jgi:4-hydroxy-tetrahydrodipicolinate synthase|nr:dihydrodipicolinate synthase family protein [Gemmatimonadales bacterium]